MDLKRPTRVSIVTCSFNQRRYLETAMRSVLTQKGVDLEYIVIDGGSSDGSAEVVERNGPSLAYWVSERDHGQSEALNKGLRRATGDIVGWLCSDDVLLPGALERMVHRFDADESIDAIYGNAVLIDSEDALIRLKREIAFHPWILSEDHNYIPQPAMFWRRRLHDSLGYLREDLHLTMDLELWLRFARHAVKVVHVDDYWAAMRCHDLQKVFTQTEALRAENEALRKEYEAVGPRVHPRAFAAMAARTLRVILKALEGGYRSGVPRTVVEALKAIRGVEGGGVA